MGVQTDLSEAVTQGKVSMRVTEERLLKLGAIIEEILDADELPPPAPVLHPTVPRHVI